MYLQCIVILQLLLISVVGFSTANGSLVNSEVLKSFVRKTVDKLLSYEQLSSIYWNNEPLSASSLSKATGINVTMVETHFQIEHLDRHLAKNEIPASAHGDGVRKSNSKSSLIQDILVEYSMDRDRSYSLLVNLEIENPFKTIDVYYEPQGMLSKQHLEGNSTREEEKIGLFRIHLPQSSLSVQLNQRLRYDECLKVNYVQLSPSVIYAFECVDCEESERTFLDKIFRKRMSQLDAELDSILVDKLMVGLQELLSVQRLDLDMYLN